MLDRFGAAVLALILLPANAPFDPEEAFGARESIQSVSLSPDGHTIAYVAPSEGQGSRLYAVSLAHGTPHAIMEVDGVTRRLSGCRWVSNERLMCSLYRLTESDGEILTTSRWVAFDNDGQNVQGFDYSGRVIDWNPGREGFVLQQEYGKNFRLGVSLLNTQTGKTQPIVSPKVNGAFFVSDGQGNVRIMATGDVRGATGQAGQRLNFFHRAPGESDWHKIGAYDGSTNEGPYPVAVDPERNAAYIFEKTDGRDALYRFSLDGSNERELLLAHDEVDVDTVLRIGRAGRVVGASYATERRERIYFDPELKNLAADLSKALPGLPLIRFADASQDERKLLIHGGSDTDPGRYYLYEKGSRKLNEVMLSRPQLEGARLAEMKPVNYRATDGTVIPAYLTLPVGGKVKGLPAIVMPHGGPHSRDEWGFDWLAQYFAYQGFAVLQPNFRGSAGYGEEWFQTNGFQSWRTAIGDINDAGRWLVSEGIAEPSKLAIVGWSFGGYAALQSAVLDADLFKAIIAIAPVTDLAVTKDEARGWANHANTRDFIGSGPHIKEGSPAQNASAIRAPVLIFHGDYDQNVGIEQSRLMQRRLKEAGKSVELIVYPKLDHSLMDSGSRADMLGKSDAFLRIALKLD